MITDWHIKGIRGTPPFYAELYPCISLVTRGKLLDWWIHKHYKAFNVVTKIYYPENPRTALQQGNRTVFYDGFYNWHHFDNNVKGYYNEIAKKDYKKGVYRYISLYLKANLPMIIYWDTLEKNAGDISTVPDYVTSGYLPSVHFARNIYWQSQVRNSGLPQTVPVYIASSDFAKPLYPPAVNKLVALGSSGDLPLPGNLSVNGQVAINGSRIIVQNTGDQVFTNNAWVYMAFPTETVDNLGEWDTGLHRFTAIRAGTYQISFKIHLAGFADQAAIGLTLYVGGSEYGPSFSWFTTSGTGTVAVNYTFIVSLTAGQTVQVKGYHNTGSDKTISAAGKSNCLEIVRLQ